MLLPEFAVEPESLNTWPRLQLFTALFGVEKGRLVSRFPRKWLQRACRAVYQGPARDVDRTRCVERLRSLKDAMLVEDSAPWPERPTWVENALERHRTRPFQAIVTAADCGGRPEVVPWDDVDAEHPRLSVDTGVTIERTPEVMAACVAQLLRVASEVVFVDRYFVPTDQKWVGPLAAFLGYVADRDDLRKVLRLEFHTAIQSGDPSVYRRNCEQQLATLVPPGLSLDVVLCEWGELHNRFVLTDRGGFQFGHGLSAVTDGHDHVNILSESQWRGEWARHSGRGPLCAIAGPVEV